MNKFVDFFGRYIETKNLPDGINNSIISNIKIDSEQRIMNIYAECGELLDRRDIFEAERKIQESVLNLSHCFFRPHYESMLFDVGYYPQLVMELKRRNASLNGTLNDSMAEIVGNRIVIYLQHGGKDLLEAQNFGKNLSELIKSEFGVKFDVDFSGVLSIDSESQVYIEQQKTNEEKVLREVQIESQQQYESMMKTANERKAQYTKPATEDIPKTELEIEIREGESLIPTYIPESAAAIYGGSIKGEKHTELKKVNANTGKVVVWGQIFSVEVKDTKNKNKIISMKITDFTGSITLKVIGAPEKCKGVLELKTGMAVLVKGTAQYDNFDHDTTMMVSNISIVAMPKIVDKAEKKRVELHLHTNMSAMDGVTGAKDLINRAYSWGMPAIAITDHGVAQAYPDAMNACDAIEKKGGKFKIIYGVELYLT